MFSFFHLWIKKGIIFVIGWYLIRILAYFLFVCKLRIFLICIILIINPLYSISILPFPFSFFSFGWNNHSDTMLKSILPGANILFFVWPSVNSKAVFFSKSVIPFVNSAIWPGCNAFAMHLSVLPGANIFSLIIPSVNSLEILIN